MKRARTIALVVLVATVLVGSLSYGLRPRELVYRAAMLDPNTAATLTTSEIVAMVDDLIEAHGELIPAPIRSE